MVFEDKSYILTNAFRSEFNKIPETTRVWYDFIFSKDLGVEYIYIVKYPVYKVIDEKKWIFTRLKYGI